MKLKRPQSISVSTLDIVGNQIAISTSEGRYFFSYETKIAFIPNEGKPIIYSSYNYSVTTGRYLGTFIGHGKEELERCLRDYEYLYAPFHKELS